MAAEGQCTAGAAGRYGPGPIELWPGTRPASFCPGPDFAVDSARGPTWESKGVERLLRRHRNGMKNYGSYLRARGIFSATIPGAAVFSFGGQWAFDSLVEYGFEIFSPTTVLQEPAILFATMIIFPASAFPDLDPTFRVSMAVNGASWGAVYVISTGGIYFKEHLSRTGTTPQ